MGGSRCCKRARWVAWVAFVVLLLAPLRGAGEERSVRIRRVIDGDTAVLQDGRRVRYLGINAPERGQPYFAEATALNRRLTEGRRVRLEEDQVLEDGYKRLLAYVYLDGEMVNARLIEAGLAHLLVIPPNLKHYDRLLELERRARAGRRGIWRHLMGPLKITALHANAPGNDRLNPNGEYMRIANVTGNAVRVGGFTVTDRYGHRYTFPGLWLKPGYSVLLLSGRGVDLTDPRDQILLYWQSNGPIWNNDGDTATLRAPDGSPVDVFEYRGRRH
ncbi:MAG: thermonuclease family protein [Candidatus Methylomirabilales bacterium]